MNWRANDIYKKVLEAMQEAEELDGVVDVGDYLELMDNIRHEAVKRFNNCVDTRRMYE